MRRFRLEMVGMVPLLMHSLDPDCLDPSKPAGKTKPDGFIGPNGSPEWWKYAYFDEKIGCYVPSDCIYKMMQDAGSKVIYRGKERMGNVCKSYVFASPDKIHLLEKGKPVLKLEDLVPFKKACNGQGGKKGSGRVLRIRPIFFSWSCVCDLVVTNDDIPEERLRETVDVAGIGVGVLDWRPLFGRFVADLKLIKD